MTSAPTYEGLDQNYDFIYEALLEGATVYLRINNFNNSGMTAYALVASWLLDPSHGLVLFAMVNDGIEIFEFTNGSYHTVSEK